MLDRHRNLLPWFGLAWPITLAIVGGALLGVASRTWPEHTVMWAGIGLAAFLGLFGTPSAILSHEKLKERARAQQRDSEPPLGN